MREARRGGVSSCAECRKHDAPVSQQLQSVYLQSPLILLPFCALLNTAIGSLHVVLMHSKIEH